MNESEWLWVVVRVLGLYVTLQTSLAPPGLLGYGYQTLAMHQRYRAIFEALEVPDRSQQLLWDFVARCRDETLALGVRFLVFVVAAFNLLRRGAWVHRILGHVRGESVPLGGTCQRV